MRGDLTATCVNVAYGFLPNFFVGVGGTATILTNLVVVSEYHSWLVVRTYFFLFYFIHRFIVSGDLTYLRISYNITRLQIYLRTIFLYNRV